MKGSILLVIYFVAVSALPRQVELDPSFMVKEGETPFMGALEFCRLGSCVADFSAVIVSPSWVLTAASCGLGNFNNGTVRSWRVSAAVYELPNNHQAAQSRRVTNVYSHPKYDPYNEASGYNVALMKLLSPFTFDDNVKAVRLPAQGTKPTTSPVYFYGYGKTYNRNGHLLAAYNQKLISYEDCVALAPYKPHETTSICTVSSGTLRGDVGGPLLQGGTLIGIVSHNTTSKVTVHTPIHLFVDWIKQNVNETLIFE